MNRKLHNTASALMVSSTLLVLALMARASDGAPNPPSAPVAVAVASAGLAATAPVAVMDSDSRARSGRASRIRHSVAMPFFSFASRG